MNNIVLLNIDDVKEMTLLPQMENGYQVLYDYRQEHV